MNTDFKLKIINQISEIQKIHELLNDFYKLHGLPIKLANSFDLAAEEIVTNIISYAYTDKSKHEIDIYFSITSKEFILQITDDGIPFNPLEFEEPELTSPIEERQIGGLGIHLIKNLMDNINYTYIKNRNCITMTKNK